jgi:hypothetical protein
MSVGAAVRDLWRRTFEEIGGDKDFTTIVQVLERDAGVEVKRG